MRLFILFFLISLTTFAQENLEEELSSDKIGYNTPAIIYLKDGNSFEGEAKIPSKEFQTSMINYRVGFKTKIDGKKRRFSFKKKEIDSIAFTEEPKTTFYLYKDKKGKLTYYRILRRGKNFMLVVYPGSYSYTTNAYGTPSVQFNTEKYFDFNIVPVVENFEEIKPQLLFSRTKKATFFNNKLAEENELLAGCTKYEAFLKIKNIKIKDVLRLFYELDENCGQK